MNVSRDGKVDFSVTKYVSPGRDDRRLCDGDVLFNNTNSPELIGKTAYVPKAADWGFSNHMTRLVFHPELNAKFMALQLHFLWMVKYYLHNCVKHVNQASISSTQLARFVPLIVPPIVEQQAIVEKTEALFSTLDKGIEQFQQLRQRLKQYHQSVLKAAFEGKLTAGWRAEQKNLPSAEELLAQIQAERENRYLQQLPLWRHGMQEGGTGSCALGKTHHSIKPKDLQPLSQGELADLPRLPEGWIWVRTRDVGDVQLGRQRSPQHHHGKHMRPYLRVANVFEDRIDLSDVMSMNFTPTEFETYHLNYGDILLNEGQSLELVGRPAMYRDELPDVCFQNTLVRFRSFGSLLPEYALLVFRAYLHTGRFQKIAKYTVNIAHLGAGRFAQLEFPLPTLAEQEQLVREIGSRFSVLDELEKVVEQGLRQVEVLRLSILKRAFEGRLLTEAELAAVEADPAYEPAEMLLERIHAEKAAAETSQTLRKGRKKWKSTGASQVKPRLPRGERYRQAAFTAYAVYRLADRQTFGRTQQMKYLYLLPHLLARESHIHAKRDAAGPYDRAIIDIESLGKKKGWFKVRKVGQRYIYERGAHIQDACDFAREKFGDKTARVDWLLNEFARWDTEEAELVATTFAVWNDALIDGRNPTEAEIVTGVHNWHPDKAPKFPPPRIRESIAWMKNHDLVPTGMGPKTEIVSKAG